MPTYQYRCTNCEHDFALKATVAEYDDGLDATCPKCGSDEVKRRIGDIMISSGSSGDGAPRCTPGGGCC
ncbi:MAG: zinc ribbon domain-containing protein [Longimonas sp.]|uniref:FmdB family zinc ribbon protein n=1 Tax=Longimonas sp. TaxID=2039626 RepID=UPI00397724AA